MYNKLHHFLGVAVMCVWYRVSSLQWSVLWCLPAQRSQQRGSVSMCRFSRDPYRLCQKVRDSSLGNYEELTCHVKFGQLIQ